MEDLAQTFIESIRPIIVEEVRKQVSELAPVSDGNEKNPYVTAEWVCDLVHITPATRINYNKKGILKPRHIGSRVLYVKSEVMEAIESGKLSRYSHK